MLWMTDGGEFFYIFARQPCLFGFSPQDQIIVTRAVALQCGKYSTVLVITSRAAVVGVLLILSAGGRRRRGACVCARPDRFTCYGVPARNRPSFLFSSCVPFDVESR